MAIYINNLEIIKELVKQDPSLVMDYDESYRSVYNLLQIAAEAGHIEIIQFFLEKGVDPNFET